MDDTLLSHSTLNYDADIEHFCEPVEHPDIDKTITKYKKRVTDLVMKDSWTKAMWKRFGSLAQGNDLPKIPGMNSRFAFDYKQIKNVLNTQTIRYAQIVLYFQPQEIDPNQVLLQQGET